MENIKKYTFRDLTEDEIEVKISNIQKEGKGLQLLLYKTARVDSQILDETFGCMNWQPDYKEIKGNLYCGISVYDKEKKEWITKWDCGVESAFGDKEKGEASDAFKRAGFKWGIGVELYTKIFIYIFSDDCQIKHDDNNNKFYCNDKFEVSNIEIKNKKIIKLEIINTSLNNKVVFKYQNNKNINTEKTSAQIDKIKTEAMKNLIKRKGADVKEIIKYYKIKDLSELNEEQYTQLYENLDKREDIA